MLGIKKKTNKTYGRWIKRSDLNVNAVCRTLIAFQSKTSYKKKRTQSFRPSLMQFARCILSNSGCELSENKSYYTLKLMEEKPWNREGVKWYVAVLASDISVEFFFISLFSLFLIFRGLCVCAWPVHNLWLLTRENGINVSLKIVQCEFDGMEYRWILMRIHRMKWANWMRHWITEISLIFVLNNKSEHFYPDWWESPIFQCAIFSSRKMYCDIFRAYFVVTWKQNCCIIIIISSSKRNRVYMISLHVTA